MANGRKRITNTSSPSTEKKRQRLQAKFSEYKHPEFDSEFCWGVFILAQLEKGNSEQTISFYKRFYKKYSLFWAEATAKDFPDFTMKQQPIEHLTNDGNRIVFVSWLKKQGLNTQTINAYLRGLRAWGNWCEEEGYIDGFKCPIKEVLPPVKNVYTDSELNALMVKPDINEFANFRSYCIISLILNTGARSNTILNVRLCDVDIDEGYINFNTLKNHSVVRLGLDRKTKRDLSEWLEFWRYGKGAEDKDFLFCNEYGEQLSRSSLDQSIARYNKSRGVEKTSLHLLRHTFAKKWITSGGDIISLAKVLTHSELEMVKRYSNLYSDDIKDEITEHSAISQLKTTSGKSLKNQKKKLTDK